MSVHSSAGSSRLGAIVVVLVVALVPRPVSAETEAVQRADRVAEIRIGLPDERPGAAVTFGAAELTLGLPYGAQIPLDLQSLGGGLILGVEARAAEGGGTDLVLRLGGASLERIEVADGFLTVRLAQRGRSSMGGPVAEGTYRIGVEDLIQVSVNGDPELTRQVVVGPSGTVVAPLIGEIVADGLTTGELAERLTDLLARDYLVNPRVEVQIIEYRSKWVLVSGAVRVPGRVVLRGRSELKQAIADAGGFTESAGQTIVISRTDPQSGENRQIVVGREEFETGIANVPVQHGDLVTVHEKEYCHILGEVRVPQRIPIERGLTLFRALSAVGGLSEFANRKEIQVLRQDGTVDLFDLQKIQKGEAEDPPIRGGDRIYVKRRFL